MAVEGGKPEALHESEQIIALNVSGRIFYSRKETLLKYSDSLLGLMFSGKYELLKDDDGRVFIERSGELFGYILNYLQFGAFLLPPSFPFLEQLKEEIDYFQLPIPNEVLYKALLSRVERSAFDEIAPIFNILEEKFLSMISSGLNRLQVYDDSLFIRSPAVSLAIVPSEEENPNTNEEKSIFLFPGKFVKFDEVAIEPRLGECVVNPTALCVCRTLLLQHYNVNIIFLYVTGINNLVTGFESSKMLVCVWAPLLTMHVNSVLQTIRIQSDRLRGLMHGVVPPDKKGREGKPAQNILRVLFDRYFFN